MILRTLVLLAVTLIVGQSPSATIVDAVQIPPILKPGDMVGAITPGAALGKDKAKYTLSVNRKFNEFGLKVKFGAHCFDRYWGYMASTDANRADDINHHLHDDDITAIISNRGGWGCNKLYDRIDWASLMSNPKIVMGYSDVTGLSNAIAVHTGVVAFHGAMTIDGLWKGGVNHHQIQTVLMRSSPTLTLKRHFDYWHTITGGTTTGTLRGGNLNVFANMIYSDEMPVEALDGAILVLEETGDRPQVLDRNMLALKHAGVFRRIAGLAFGQCDKCGGKMGLPLNDRKWGWRDIATMYAKEAGVPAFFGLFFGHHMSAGQIFLPLGAHVTLDADAGTITTTHPVVTADPANNYVPDKAVVWLNSAYRRSDGMHVLRVIASVAGRVSCAGSGGHSHSAQVTFPFDAVLFEFGTDPSAVPAAVSCTVTDGRSREVSEPVRKRALWKKPLPLVKPKTGFVNNGVVGFFSPGKWYSNVKTGSANIIANIAGVTGLSRQISSVNGRYNWFSGTDDQRAAAFMEMVQDPTVSVMMVNSGQAGICRILDKIDYDVVRRSDKVIIGAGSSTCLINAVVSKAGLVAYYGPVTAENMSNGVNFRYLSQALAQNVPMVYDAHESWWSTIYGGTARGPLIGGEIHTLSTIAGTEYMPVERFDGAILFLTDNNQVTYHIDRHLSKLFNMGVFDRVAGVVMGTCMDGQCEKLQGVEQVRPNRAPWHVYDIIKQYVGKRRGGRPVPTFTGATFGVGAGSNMIFPIGVMAELNADAGTISLLESPLGRAAGTRPMTCFDTCRSMFSQDAEHTQCASVCERPSLCSRCQNDLRNVGCVAGCAVTDARMPTAKACAQSDCAHKYGATQCALGCKAGVGLAATTNCMHVDEVHQDVGAFYACVYGQTKGH